MKDTHKLLIMDYLEGNWDEQKETQLQQLMMAQEIDPKELQAWQQLYAQTGTLPQPAPSERLRENFYAMLSQEKRSSEKNLWQQFAGWLQQNPSIRLSHLVIGMVLVAIGIAIGFYLNPTEQYKAQISGLSGEIQQMREVMVLTLLEQPSATQRLKAVSITTGLQQADAKVYNALLRTLNEDAQVNVRLAALEALLQYAQDPIVREGLVQSISLQSSPLVQIALAEAMVKMQETQAVDPLKNLLEHEDLNEVAKQAIEKSIRTLI